MTKPTIITLIGKSQKGKQRIIRWGSKWEIIESYPHRIGVVALGDDSVSNVAQLPESFRWIDLPFDRDMEIL